jgi:hypothetical protein
VVFAFAALLLMMAAAQAQSLAPRSMFGTDRGARLFDVDGAEGGIRAGSFDVRAAAGLSFGMDSNVYAAPDGNEAEAMTTGEALVRASNQSATRDIAGMAFIRARRYEESRDQDATEFGALARYDGWINPQNRLVFRVIPS